MNYERHACSALVGTVLAATQATCRRVVANKFLGLVYITVVKHRAVVTGKYDKGVVKQSLLFESAYNLAYAPIELHDGIAAQSHLALSAETWMRKSRNMDIICGKVHEERCIAVLLDEFNRMGSYAVGNVLVLPKRLAATLHVTYASDAVDN